MICFPNVPCTVLACPSHYNIILPEATSGIQGPRLSPSSAPPSLDSLLAPSYSAKEAVVCAGLGPRLCVFQATDKRKALEETMAFTTQALASVAYQVGNLAGHTLRMLDLQGAALRQVEAKMSTLGQVRTWEGVPFPSCSSSNSDSLCDKGPLIFSVSAWSI